MSSRTVLLTGMKKGRKDSYVNSLERQDHIMNRQKLMVDHLELATTEFLNQLQFIRTNYRDQFIEPRQSDNFDAGILLIIQAVAEVQDA